MSVRSDISISDAREFKVLGYSRVHLTLSSTPDHNGSTLTLNYLTDAQRAAILAAFGEWRTGEITEFGSRVRG